jgi:parallel beta-helix repeat protein
MMHSRARVRGLLPLALCSGLLLAASTAGAFPGSLSDWQQRYGAASQSGDNAQCQLCHAEANGGDPWNGYGWDIRNALADQLPGGTCDLNGDGDVSNDEAFFCVELLNSDGNVDGSGSPVDNVTEIGVVPSAQPGWTDGPFNTLYFKSGLVSTGELPPADIGKLDPDGTEPPPEPPPPPPDDDADLPPGQLVRRTIVVRPGDSIQAAIDRARPGTRIYVLAGVYRELSNPVNGLNITKNGIRLIGQSAPGKQVVFENAGNQRNGIVVVPEDRVDCMGCHSDLAPPFPTLPGVEPGLKMREPMMYGFEIRNITIRGFDNNGLFTENVDGFKIINVHSVDNHNYGIFPTLSKNGLVTHSSATGSDTDSGIWVETSENVVVTHNYVADNVNGFEVSNSDDILLAHNEAENNTIGAAILLLPDIFDDRAGAKRIDMRDNHIHDNNKPNTARPGSILSFIPPGIGILYLGVDDSLISGNRVTGNDFVGIGVSDYCLPLIGTPFQCPPPLGFPGLPYDPSISMEFLLDQAASNNRVEGNDMRGNASNPPGPPFGGFAGDAALLTFSDNGNCYEGNLLETYASTLGVLPPCP